MSFCDFGQSNSLSMDSETGSSCDESVDDQVMVSSSGSLIVLNASTCIPRPSTSSSSSLMTVDETLIFSKLQGKLRLKNLHLIQLNKDTGNPLVTTLVCESNASGTTLSDKVAKFKISISIGSPLSLEPLSNERPHSPLFDPIEENAVSDFYTACREFARTTRSLMTLLDFIDSYLEKSPTGCPEDGDAPLSPVSDILRELHIRSDEEAHASDSDIIPSSGSTASRRSSRSTTPTMSDRIE